MQTHEQLIEMLNSPQEEERIQALKRLFRDPSPENPKPMYAALGDASWRVRKEAVELFLQHYAQEHYVPDVIEMLHAPENAGLRNAAVEILISLGERSIPCLNDELKSCDKDVRKFVLDIMGEIGSPATVPLMIGALDDPDENVRAAAAENLGKMGSVDAIPSLLEHLEDPDLLFRFTILASLGQIGAAVPAERLLTFRHDPLLRNALIECLGQIGAVEALPFLVECLADSQRNVRQAAAVALHRLSVRYPNRVSEALRNWKPETACDTIDLLLESHREEVRRAALLFAECLGEQALIPRLVPLLGHEITHEGAARALVAIGREFPQALIDFWRCSEGETRAYLSLVLGDVGCGEIVPFLIGELEALEDERRLAAAQSLGKLPSLQALRPLLQLLKDPEADVRESALIALEMVCPHYAEEAFELIYPLLSDENPYLRMCAVRALGTLEYHPGVEKALARALKDDSAQVRMTAIRAGRFSGRSLSALTLALTDEDPGVRQEAVERLGALADPQVAELMASSLQDEDIWVRRAAVAALGRAGGRQALSLVKKALNDPVGLVTICALEVLSDLDPEGCRTSLREALNHRDDQVVVTALKILGEKGEERWLFEHRESFLHHPSDEVRMAYVRFSEEVIESSGDQIQQDLSDLLASSGRGG